MQLIKTFKFSILQPVSPWHWSTIVLPKPLCHWGHCCAGGDHQNCFDLPSVSKFRFELQIEQTRTHFQIEIMSPNSNVWQRINFFNALIPNLEWFMNEDENKFTIEYHPTFTEDGQDTWRSNCRNASSSILGNESRRNATVSRARPRASVRKRH